MNKISKYERLRIGDKLEAVRGLVASGIDISAIAEELGVKENTIKRWRKQHREFDDCFLLTPKLLDGSIVNSALKMALGYEIVEEKPLKVKDDVEIIKTKKHVPPSGSVCLALLDKMEISKEDLIEIVMNNESGELSE